MNFLIRGLWIQYENEKLWNPNTDTVIQFTADEEALYYNAIPLADSLFSLEPKYAEKTATYFELKTGLKRSKVHKALNLIPVLDKRLIHNWTIWYRKNRNQVELKELERIVH